MFCMGKNWEIYRRIAGIVETVLVEKEETRIDLHGIDIKTSKQISPLLGLLLLFPKPKKQGSFSILVQDSNCVEKLFTMTKFRPCIDLHSGQVKQIVGGTLTTASSDLKTNYVSKLPAGHFAKLYKENGLTGGHVIMLGSGNEEAARETVGEWKNGLQVGGGITNENAKQWIAWGAERVCFCYITGG